MPADGAHKRLHLVKDDGSRDGTTAAAREVSSFEAMFVSNLEVVESVTRYVCQRHRLPAVEAQDFGSDVKAKLIESDYEVFRKFQQRSSLRAYLTIVIQRFYLDYRKHFWGKWRPSAEARRLGDVAIRLETLIVRDGFSFDQACEHLRTNEGVAATHSELVTIFVRLPLRTRRATVDAEGLEEMADPTSQIEDHVLFKERQAAARRILDALTNALRALGDQDRLILRLRFQDGLTIANIARALHLEQKPLYRRFEALLHQLRRALEAGGIDAAQARDIVRRMDVDISLALHGGMEASASIPRPDDAQRTGS
jgi:RNA polymerase sigma factor (sigma-70 family)